MLVILCLGYCPWLCIHEFQLCICKWYHTQWIVVHVNSSYMAGCGNSMRLCWHFLWNLYELERLFSYVTQHHQMRHKLHTKVLSKLRKNSQNLQNRVVLRNSKEILLFSIFSVVYDSCLGFRYVLHRFYYWLYVSLM